MAGEKIDAHDQLGHARVHDEIDRPPGLVIARACVERDAAALLRETHPHAEGPVAQAVAVHRVLALVAAVWDPGLERLADRVAALLLEERPRREHGVRAEAVEQLQQAALAELAASQHRADVALQDLGEARVANEDAEGLVVQHALAVDADGGDDDALVEDLRRVRRDAARAHAADVPEVAPGLREGDEAATVE